MPVVEAEPVVEFSPVPEIETPAEPVAEIETLWPRSRHLPSPKPRRARALAEPYSPPAEEPTPAPMQAWTPPAPKAEEPPPEPVRAPVVEREEIPAVAQPVAPPAPHLPDLKDLPGYWRFLRGGAEFPSSDALDRDVVAARWPGSLLIAFMRNAQDPRSEPSLARVTRLGVANADAENAVDYAPYATEWMLDLGRAVLAAAEPIEELQRLPTRAGASGFRLIALPLGPLNGDPDSVLCQLMPDTAAPRFGKKRNWLED